MSALTKVLFLAAEADPFVKVGGLGDVAGSLPRVLRSFPPEEGGASPLDVRLALPFHPVLRSKAASLRPVAAFSLPRAGSEVAVQAFETTSQDLPVYFIGGAPIDESGSVYSSNAAMDAEKYVFFSLAALALCRQLGWHPDIVHANDWHTALAVYALLVQHWQEGSPRPASVITVHNLPYLGPDVHEVLKAYGIPLAQTDLPDWARLKPMPLGLWAADAIVAVSPTYADEMLSPEYGAGLQDFLKSRRETLTGILNGIDTERFDPATDSRIAARFTSESLSERTANKTALLRQVGLSADLEAPLFGVVSRMDSQKGLDLVMEALRKLADTPWQAVMLGTGDPKLEGLARKLVRDFPEKVRLETRYDPGLARQIYAGADIFLMPSRYEPCGLSQMIAMRYGCVPVVRAVGGLHDTVTDGETGFVFIEPKVKPFLAAIQRAVETWRKPEKWRAIQLKGMTQDFSWNKSASHYAALYRRLLSSRTIARL
ncbi:MAG: glycogen synthase GlgA [Anaerolineales bacterium]